MNAKLTGAERRLLRRFGRRRRLAQAVLAQRFGKDLAAAVAVDAAREYEGMVREIAQLSGGLMNGAFASTYEYLAYAKALRTQRVADPEIGAFFDDLYSRLIGRVPRWLMRLVMRIGKPLLRRRLRREAGASQACGEGSPGWRFEFVEGRAKSGDFGIDVTQCAVCHLFARHDAEQLVPYLCALDDKISATLDLGLRREGTIALGADHCDFRFRQGGTPKPLSPREESNAVFRPAGASSPEAKDAKPPEVPDGEPGLS